VQREFQVDFHVADMFKSPTIRAIATFVEKRKSPDRNHETADAHHRFASRTEADEMTSVPSVSSVAAFIEVEAAEQREYYPLSPAQKRLFILQQMEPASTAYNISLALELAGRPDRNRLAATVNALARRHAAFRTSFLTLHDRPCQRVHEDTEVAIDFKSGTMPKPFQDIIREFIRPFDLSTAPLVRVGLVTLEEEKHLLLLDMHHIICDGTSSGILARDFMDLYSAKTLPALKVNYTDYSLWQQREQESGVLKAQEQYWLSRFPGELPVLELPLDFRRPRLMDFVGRTLDFSLDRTCTSTLKDLARLQGVTLYMVLTALYSLLLSKLSGGQEDIVIGTPVAGGRFEELQQVTGMFVNTLALRTCPAAEKSFNTFLKDVESGVMEAFENQDYPFEELVEKMAVQRDTSRNPVFDTMLVYNNLDIPELEIPGLKLKPYTFDRGISKFDLTLTVVEQDDRLKCSFEYSTRLFRAETVQRFGRYLQQLVETVGRHPGKELAHFEIITPQEKQQILSDFNDTTTDFPSDRTIHRLFEEQVQRTPDRIAVTAGSIVEAIHLWVGCAAPSPLYYPHPTPIPIVSLTYRELNRRSNQLARLLREKGVSADTIVAVSVDRSVEMMAAILAILKAGGAYLPVDPFYPEERIHYLLADSGSPVLLTEERVAASVGPRFGGDIIRLEDTRHYCGSGEDLEPVKGPDNLLYVIYTSGSTGKPRGVMVPVRGFVNLVHWYMQAFAFNPDDRILTIASTSFDLAQRSLFGPLLTGACMCLPLPGLFDYTWLSEFIPRQQVTLVNCAPSVFYPLLEFNRGTGFTALQSLRYVSLGGEPIKLEKLQPWAESASYSCRVVNMYGPTECTDTVTSYVISRDQLTGRDSTVIPIGKPLPNVKIHILDRHRYLLPVGIGGEICISGIGITRGYLNRPQLTADKFIPSPFTLHSSLFYKTGDLGRWLADGNIEFLGRIDHQVKVRGNRIEPGEIENRLLAHPRVTGSVVIARESSGGDNYLCAYLVADNGHAGTLDVTEMKEYLARTLPDYMVPSYFMELERIPLTPNGKVDCRALPEPGIAEKGLSYTPPGDEVEARLLGIWSELLEIPADRIGIDTGFFQLHGHSLSATLMVSRIKQVFNASVKLTDIFNFPTIRDIARKIRESRQKEQFAAIEAMEKKEYYPLSSAQKRLYILQQMETGSTVYNVPAVLLLEGTVDIDKFTVLFKALIVRHESLRTSFHIAGEQPVQRVHDQVAFDVEQRETGPEPAAETVTEFIRPFDLAQPPLLRVAIMKTGDNTHLLLIDMHHIVSDGMSLDILARDFMTLYGGGELPPLQVQYKDYACWLETQAQEDVLKQQEVYWLKQFETGVPVPDLPLDFARPPVQEFAGKTFRFEVGAAETATLIQWAAGQGATLYMALLSLVYILMSKLGGQEEVVIGTPVAGRQHSHLEPVIGMFVNTLALKNTMPPDCSISKLLEDVRNNTLAAFENQDYPFEELVEQVYASGNRDMSRSPLFDVMFAFQNFGIDAAAVSDIRIPGLRLVPWDRYRPSVSKFDLSLVAAEEEDRLLFFIEYRTGLFKEETIRRFAGFFKRLLSAALETPGQLVSDMEIISPAEKRQILEEFNNTAVDYPQEKNLVQLFADQVHRTPDQIAVIGGSGIVGAIHESPLHCAADVLNVFITYKELDHRSNRLAAILIAKGVEPGTIVAVYADRIVETVIAIFAILKTGAAYLPIDPGYPQERIEYMLRDSSVKVAVGASSKLALDWETENCQSSIVNYELSMNGPAEHLHHSPAPAPAYLIYTSGSTGRPKGVLVTHGSVHNLVTGLKREIYSRFSSEEKLRAAILAPFVFDASVQQVFGTLLLGHALCIVPENTRTEGFLLADYYRRFGIDCSDGTPVHLRLLQETINAGAIRENGRPLPVRHFLIGGEALPWTVVEEFLACFPSPGPAITNVYGPTECCVDSSFYHITPGETGQGDVVPIGRPMPNETIYILDRNGLLQPVGIPGELCIAGHGVGCGYLNNPELTAEKFTSSPRHPVTSSPLYHSGDLACWLPDGNIRFLGRIDQQVKIRGYRIEPGEIEALLLTHPLVDRAVVTARTADSGDSYLCTYIVAGTVENDEDAFINRLKEHISAKLPDYMVPQYFILLEEIPVTANGKINRSALPEPDTLVSDGIYTAARDETEERLVRLWQEVLFGSGAEGTAATIGIDDDFFKLGGHSLKATILAARIYKHSHVRLPLTQLFRSPTVRGVSAYLKAAVKETYIAIEPAKEREYYPLSSAQQQFYILHQMKTSSTHYNIPTALRMQGPLDREKLAITFRKLIERHESLRTSFRTVGGKPFQKIHENVEFRVEELETGFPAALKHFIRPFDLSQAPLLRVGLVRQETEVHILLVDLHHIVTDGMSTVVLVKDFMALYAGETLAPLPIQYKDYALWQQQGMESAWMKRQEEYWLRELNGNLPELRLPTDFPRSEVLQYVGAQRSFQFDDTEYAALKELALEQGTTLYGVLLTLFIIMLYKLSGQEEIVIGAPVANRRHPDLEGIIGMFVNSLVLRNFPRAEKDFCSFLQEVAERILEVHDNQEYPFDRLVEKLLGKTTRSTSRNPLFEVIFLLQNIETAELKIEGVTFQPYDIHYNTSAFDLVLLGSDVQGALSMRYLYSTALFKEETIERFEQYYREIVRAVLQDRRIKLGDITITVRLADPKAAILEDADGDFGF
jgi:amino acid adenylation domain-containing protein